MATERRRRERRSREALMASEFDRFEDLAKQLVNTPKPQS